jgi:hypothetical protein
MDHAARSSVRVLRIITRLNIGGPSIQAIALSDRLSARGFETELVHGRLGDGEGDMRYLFAPGMRARYLPSLRRPIAPFHDAFTLARLLDLMRDIRPHIVHTHMAKAGTLGRLAAAAYNATAGRNNRARVVHTYHGHVLEGYFDNRTAKMFTAAERQLARVTDAIIAISPQIRTELLDDFHIGRPDQYRVIPLGFARPAPRSTSRPMREWLRQSAGSLPSSSTICFSRQRRSSLEAIHTRCFSSSATANCAATSSGPPNGSASPRARVFSDGAGISRPSTAPLTSSC